ncbi:hypothetical protein HYH03_014639 [Edaphochlamys debaryana]|uniref:Uncharacterized protein n=1 Tax=Edaphochlamys debaryana TaxID=47281 RepID=A0A835XR38_9CHLO|nr:hypothetical protein HYH03_014639 [Edaphochlamys debaryana]|eukprot:KAG2486711.1 hypothetical protein HYH03_014639 [Edaphochlamys debaryana]
MHLYLMAVLAVLGTVRADLFSFGSGWTAVLDSKGKSTGGWTNGNLTMQLVPYPAVKPPVTLGPRTYPTGTAFGTTGFSVGGVGESVVAHSIAAANVLKVYGFAVAIYVYDKATSTYGYPTSARILPGEAVSFEYLPLGSTTWQAPSWSLIYAVSAAKGYIYTCRSATPATYLPELCNPGVQAIRFNCTACTASGTLGLAHAINIGQLNLQAM